MRARVRCGNFAWDGVFSENDVYEVCRNEVYSLWFGARAGDDAQGTIYALVYMYTPRDDSSTNRSNRDKKIMVTLRELEDFISTDKRTLPSMTTFKSSRINVGVAKSIDVIPRYTESIVWITERDRQELKRIAERAFNDISCMSPYMKNAIQANPIVVDDRYVLKVLTVAYQQWVNDSAYPYMTPTFERFLGHSGLVVAANVDGKDYITQQLSDVRDLKNDRVYPSMAWFVHNASCVNCSRILNRDGRANQLTVSYQ